jgi:predicted DNA-binding transcriptional regulator AlpA
MALLTTKQMQEELQVCPVTLWSYRRQGMPYLLLGGRSVRYNLSDVMEWLKAQNANSGPCSPNHEERGREHE